MMREKSSGAKSGRHSSSAKSALGVREDQPGKIAGRQIRPLDLQKIGHALCDLATSRLPSKLTVARASLSLSTKRLGSTVLLLQTKEGTYRRIDSQISGKSSRLLMKKGLGFYTKCSFEHMTTINEINFAKSLQTRNVHQFGTHPSLSSS